MEKKKVFKVFATFSQEASILLDATDSIAEVINSKDLNFGYDYDLKEFNTKQEAEAYMQGILDANGWNDPNAILI